MTLDFATTPGRYGRQLAMRTRSAARHGAIGVAPHSEAAPKMSGTDLGTCFAIRPNLSLLVLCIIFELI